MFEDIVCIETDKTEESVIRSIHFENGCFVENSIFNYIDSCSGFLCNEEYIYVLSINTQYNHYGSDPSERKLYIHVFDKNGLVFNGDMSFWQEGTPMAITISEERPFETSYTFFTFLESFQWWISAIAVLGLIIICSFPFFLKKHRHIKSVNG